MPVFQMNIIAGGFYDGLMLYTHALNESMSASGGRPPGKVVTKRMWNRTFHGQCVGHLLLCSCASVSVHRGGNSSVVVLTTRRLRIMLKPVMCSP